MLPFTSLALLTMIHFSICAHSSNLTPGDGWRQPINHPIRPSHPSTRGFVPWKKGLWQSNKLPVVIAGWSLFNQRREPLIASSVPTLSVLLTPPTWVGAVGSWTLVVATRIAMFLSSIVRKAQTWKEKSSQTLSFPSKDYCYSTEIFKERGLPKENDYTIWLLNNWIIVYC